MKRYVIAGGKALSIAAITSIVLPPTPLNLAIFSFSLVHVIICSLSSFFDGQLSPGSSFLCVSFTSYCMLQIAFKSSSRTSNHVRIFKPAHQLISCQSSFHASMMIRWKLPNKHRYSDFESNDIIRYNDVRTAVYYICQGVKRERISHVAR